MRVVPSVMRRLGPGTLAAGSALVLAATPVAAAEGSPEGAVSGTVTGSGDPVPNAWVSITPIDASGAPAGPPASAFTDESGRYEVRGLDPGAATVLVRSPPASDLVDTWFAGAHVPDRATPITVSERPVVADVDLPRGGSVSGRLVDADTGEAVARGAVDVVLADAPEAGGVGSPQFVDQPGSFALTGLPPREVRLRVRLPADSAYLASPLGDGADGPVVIDGGRETTGLRIALRRGAEIRGTVRDDRGAPVAGASVGLVGCGADCPPLQLSSEAGSYRIPGIPPGQRVGVVAWRAQDQVRQWYPGADDVSAATRIPLGAGDVVETVDFTLPRAAGVTVEVRGTRSDEPLRAVVHLTGADRTYHQYFAHDPGDTDTGGPVLLRSGPIPAGDYAVRITPGLPDPGHLPTRWETARTLDGEGSLRLAPGEQGRAVAELPATGRPPATTEASVGPPAAQWPGLSRGFLDTWWGGQRGTAAWAPPEHEGLAHDTP